MNANSYSVTKYSLEELEWQELWDIYHALRCSIENKYPQVNTKNANSIMNEIMRITNS